MPNYSHHRKDFLRYIYEKVGADPDRTLAGQATAAKDGDAQTGRTILNQLAEEGLIRQSLSDGEIRITMAGIKEVEKMDRTRFKWFVEEHPALWSVALVVITLLLGTIKDLIFKSPPPIINNYIQLPEKHDK